MYDNYMRKILDFKNLDAKIDAGATEVRATAHQVGRAAESQAILNTVLAGAVVVVLLVVLVGLSGRGTDGS